MSGSTSSDKRLALFNSKWLEKLTVFSVGWFVVTWSLLLPMIAVAGLGTASPIAAAGLIIMGLLAWTLFEYSAHRKLFHWDAQNIMAKQFVFVLHGNHHVQPNDKLRNLMPPIVSVPVGLAIWAILYAVVGSPSAWIIFGFMSGYVAYDLTHYGCHHWPMRGPIRKLIKRHHMRHHFISGEGNFAVCAIFWDRVFGTGVITPKSADQALEPAE